MAPFCVFKKSPGKPGISLVSTGRLALGLKHLKVCTAERTFYRNRCEKLMT